MIQRLSPSSPLSIAATAGWPAVPSAAEPSALRFFLTAYAGGLVFFLAILL